MGDDTANRGMEHCKAGHNKTGRNAVANVRHLLLGADAEYINAAIVIHVEHCLITRIVAEHTTTNAALIEVVYR